MPGIRNNNIYVRDASELRAKTIEILTSKGVLTYGLEIPERVLCTVTAVPLDQLEDIDIRVVRQTNADNEYIGDWRVEIVDVKKYPGFEFLILFDSPDEKGNEYESWNVCIRKN